jgi:hypothetical protein
MKAKVLYSIDQDQFVQIHRVYLETAFIQADKDFEMLKDVATTSEIYLDDVDCYGDENNG